MTTRDLTRRDFARGVRRSQRERIMRGELAPGDVAALRRFIGLSQAKFAQALEISVHTLRNWEQGRRTPEGPALALLRIAARHPRVVRENVRSAASQARALRKPPRIVPGNEAEAGGHVPSPAPHFDDHLEPSTPCSLASRTRTPPS